MSRSEVVMSSQLLLNFTVNQLKDKHVDILSVFNDKLLVSRFSIFRLFIINCEGSDLSTITINEKTGQLNDAKWTPNGNIIYIMSNVNKVVVMTELGEVITTHSQMKHPVHLSVSDDKFIYIADNNMGVYESQNDGVNWTLVLTSPYGWHCQFAMKMTADLSDYFWVKEFHDSVTYIRVYKTDKSRSQDIIAWRNITVPPTNDKQISLPYSILTDDGNTTIFISDYSNKVIHTFSIKGHYRCLLLSPHHFLNTLDSLAVDKERKLLYVGQNNGVVAMFKLSYKYVDD